ncbi:MAG: hypothetical protein ACOYMS_10350 [Terrimicrobiaceae bacterium]
MRNPKVVLLAGVLALLATVLVWRWISGWGLVTIHADKVPLSKVVKSIERQGGVRIVTNADPSMPVTLYLDRAPVYEAIDTLAIRVDGDARLAFIAAPDKKQIADVLAAFTTGANPGGWTVLSAGFGGGGSGGMMGSETVIDPRQVEWKMSDVPDRNLQTILNQGAQKTGALFATPKDWNPAIGKLPAAGKTGKMADAAIDAAKGRLEEIFLLTIRPPRPEGERSAGEGGGPGRWESQLTVLSPQRGNRGNPEWMAERAQAQIALLPAAERQEAQAQFDEMRKFWESVRNLPEEERRAKMEELMSRPEIQEKMEERMAARDSKRTPEQREQRMKRYIERKNQMKSAPAKS